MKEETIDIKSEKLFPWHVRVLGIFFIVIGVLISLDHFILSPILIIAGILMFVTYNGVEFNSTKKSYREYTSFLVMKTGKSQHYDAVEKLYVNASTVSQKVRSLSNSSLTYKNVEYDGYLKFNNGVKIYLTSDKDKNALLEELASLSTFLDIEISDNTI